MSLENLRFVIDGSIMEFSELILIIFVISNQQKIKSFVVNMTLLRVLDSKLFRAKQLHYIYIYNTFWLGSEL